MLIYPKTIVLFTLLHTGFSPYGQVIKKQPQELLALRDKNHPFSLTKSLFEKDSAYFIMFRNDKYDAIVDWQHISLDTYRLEKFYNALLMIPTLKPDENIDLGDVNITTEKANVVFYTEGGWAALTRKQVEQLAGVIKRELKK